MNRPITTRINRGSPVQRSPKKVRRTQDSGAFSLPCRKQKERASGGALRNLLRRMFGKSTEAMHMVMVVTQQISVDKLERVAKRPAEAERAEVW